jgi:glycosyltransferase involved in cell wall biosynthesis
MKKVILRGPVLSQSGYGVHARILARWLISRSDVDLKVIVTPWGNTPWLIDSHCHDGFIGEIMKRTSNDTNNADVSVQIQLPNEFTPGLARFNVGVTAGVETDRCNPKWIDAINKMDLIIVPSEFVRNTFKSSGNVTVPIEVIPESFIDACTLPDSDLPTLPSFSTPFNFLVFGQVTGDNPYNDRKNTFFTLKWLTEAFKDDPDVGIVIKTNSGRNSAQDRQATIALMQRVATESRGADGRGPKIHLLHGDMSDRDVAALYRHPQIKALVSATRGEGFGLPTLEGATSGLPVIATNWSGHLDFLNSGKFINLQYTLKTVHHSRLDNNIFVEGARWAEPDEVDFKRKVTKFRHNSVVPRQWATDLSNKLKATHSFAALSPRYDLLFEGIL